MNTREETYEVWAPSDGIWSPWVKPILFAHASPAWMTAEPPPPVPPVDLSWAPAPGGAAIVVDLDGAQGVHVGLALAEAGYRPVPLYNAAPGPEGPVLPDGSPRELYITLVDVGSVLRAVLAGTERLAGLRLPQAAPPVFLLDAARRGAGTPRPGQFDNRSVSFVTDFPSASMLRSRGIERVVLVQSGGDTPQADLAHTFVAWQAGGITIELKRLEEPGPAVPCVVRPPGLASSLWARFLALLGLRRNPLGGFGGVVPEPSAG